MNIQKFDPPLAPQKPVKERVWSKKMVKSLETTFEYLEFDFKLFKDLKASETTYRCRLVSYAWSCLMVVRIKLGPAITLELDLRE